MSLLNSLFEFNKSFISTLMNFKFVILFYGAIVLLVYLNRNRFEKQAAFVYLYKTKLGLNLMDTVGKKYRKIVKFFGYLGIIIAYLGFALVSYTLLISAYDIIIDKPGAIGGSPVIPGLPIAGLGITFPLVIGWISLFIIMIVHEFSHGMVARAHNVRVKSSGFAFFGPIMGAFVEPDDKQIAKQPHRVQNSIFAAGPVSNAVLWIVCIAILAYAIAPAIQAVGENSGIVLDPITNDTLPAYASGLPKESVITSINDYEIKGYDSFIDALEVLKPGDEVTFSTKEGKSYNLIATSHPENSSKAYVGVTNFKQDFSPKKDTPIYRLLLMILRWLSELLMWTGFISINIGLINLFPIFITDGAQMLRTNFIDIFRGDQSKALKWWKHVNSVALMILLIIVFLKPLRGLVSAFFGLL